MSHWTRRYAVPFFVSSLTAFVLAAVALVLAVVVSRPQSPARGPVQGPDCLVGTWQATSYWEMDPALRVAKLELQDEGHIYEYRSDGTGRIDFGDGITLVGDLFGADIDLVLSGDVEFRYLIEGDLIQVTDQWSNISATMLGVPTDDGVQLDTEPFTYWCEGDRLRHSLEGIYAAEFVRIS